LPTNRTRRSRQWSKELDCYRIFELMKGPDQQRLPGTGYGPVTEASTEAMRQDWALHRERLLHWWVTGENEPAGMKPWTFVPVFVPGTRPWAWWQFDAPEPLGDDETERGYLQRLDLLLPGEAELPTREERDAAQSAEIQARIDANLRAYEQAKGGNEQ
jgi:hypothetical protein